MLDRFINAANLDETKQQKEIQQLRQKAETFNTMVYEVNTTIAENQIEERINRQLHFVLERLFIRFHDMFSQFFNPTTITESGKKAQEQLERNRNHFIDYVGYELLQEVRAVSLRIESFMNGLLKESYEQIQQDISKLDDTFMIPSLEEHEFTTPSYEQAFTTLNRNIYADVLKTFKNTKSFFEQNERETMKDMFYDIMQPEAKQYLDDNKQTMREHYQSEWQLEVNQMKDLIEQEVKQIIAHHIHMMTDAVDQENLQEKLIFMHQLLDQVNEG